jgi:hypothetical protein
MSSETDHPRQRTVAELLAEHGASSAAPGRRRRRREPDGDDGEPFNGSAPPVATAAPAVAPPVHGRAAPVTGPGVAPAAWAFPNAGPDRSVLREPVPQEPVFSEPAPREEYAPPPVRPLPNRPREIPTEHLPRYGERTGMVDPGLTGPIERLPPALDEPTNDSDDDGGPATMVGAAPNGAEAWHRSRTRGATDGGPETQASAPLDLDDHPAGLDDDDDLESPRRRLGRSVGEPSTGQAWAAVVAQWIIGAIGGAALWVGFRFLWRELPVVALAAAVLVTVGLVLVVRALLRNNDMRTTVFAVLVGLLLTVSPAILVLLGR